MFDLNERSPMADAPVSVIFPVYGEAEITSELFSEWTKVLKASKRTFEIVFVDDGNPEEVTAQLNALAENAENVRVIRQDTPQGLGTALNVGIKAAQHPLVCLCSWDKQYDPGDLPKLLEKINEVDVVCGIRAHQVPPVWYRIYSMIVRTLALIFIGLSLEQRKSWFGWSGFGHRFAARWIFGVRLEDPECAFRLCRREMFERIPIQSKGTFAHTEILAKANFLNGFLTEVPIRYRPWPGDKPAPQSLQRPTWWDFQRVLSHPNFGPAKPGEEPENEPVSEDPIKPEEANAVTENSPTSAEEPATPSETNTNQPDSNA